MEEKEIDNQIRENVEGYKKIRRRYE